MNNRIYWRQDSRSTYLYGTELEFRGDSVYFKNELMPSGNLIHSWYSRTNYQRDREQPQLPVLFRNKRYSLHLEADVIPEGTVYLQIDFYNRSDETIHTKILRSDEAHFTYPNGAFSYAIHLFNANVTELLFHHIDLSSL
ncbi:accessory Sec system protein Asp3 [Streptococcus parasuis]|uniref:Accessory secretory protein Asp3 n=1 Tax=Streptococcus parasuis TaxID=1501662 RepID=A0ABV2EQK8_9STRE|nr:accessory Sec system protein Asp3 [Streptococcus parasuis]NQR00352.1 accessory Sec system protein Asp3 [Streptococcus suis]BCP60726.1 hypothetical protein SUT286_20520 [Streptococcus parasuis]